MRAVVFDLDGLLIDSEPLWQQVEIAAFGALGIPLTAADAAETTGLRIDAVVAHRYTPSGGGPSREAVTADIVARMVAAVTDRGVALPGAVDAVAAARAVADRIGLASSSPRVLIDAALARLGLSGAFDAVASAEGEPYGKPHPAVYLTLAARLGVEPARCLAVEDSVNGMIAAKAARMRCAVVPEPHAFADPRFGLADARLRSLTALDRAAVAGLLGA
ncbi:MAG: hexitol phosphatase HxpB [Myxococcota bacterium]